ncbi:MAG: YggU family protein [Nitrospira sp. WS110]|nr:YggU family protein [Nitrospira sp. WS110]
MVRDGKDGVILTVHVQPNASKTECVGVHGDALKIRLAARPVEGAANDELIRFVAECCAIPRARVHIQAGAEARRKRLRVEGISAQALLARLCPQV